MNAREWIKPALAAALGAAALTMALPTALAQNEPAARPPAEELQAPPPPPDAPLPPPTPPRLDDPDGQPPASPEAGRFGPRGPRRGWDDRPQAEPRRQAGSGGPGEWGRRGRPGPPPGPGFQKGGPEGRGGWDRPGPPRGRGFREGGPDADFCPPGGPRGMRGTMPSGPPDPDEAFALMDTNNDGAISKEEFRKFHETHRPPHPPMRGRGPGRMGPPQGPPQNIERF